MPKGIPNRRYTGEFKQMVVEAMQKEKLSYCEAARRFGIKDHKTVASWERIYLEEGAETRGMTCSFFLRWKYYLRKKQGRHLQCNIKNIPMGIAHAAMPSFYSMDNHNFREVKPCLTGLGLYSPA